MTMASSVRAITLFRGGIDTFDIAHRYNVPEAFVLKRVTVGRDRPKVYFDVWPDAIIWPRDEVIKARQTGVWNSRMRK